MKNHAKPKEETNKPPKPKELTRKIAKIVKKALDLAAALEKENLAYVFDDLDSLSVLKFLDSKLLAKIKAQVNERTYFDLLRPQIPELLRGVADYAASKKKGSPSTKRKSTPKLAKGRPTHPGAVLREDVLPALEMTQTEPARPRMFGLEVAARHLVEGVPLPRAWREHLWMTQADLAEKLAVTQGEVAQWEAPGARQNKATLKRVATAMGLHASQRAGIAMELHVSQLMTVTDDERIVVDWIKKNAEDSDFSEGEVLQDWKYGASYLVEFFCCCQRPITNKPRKPHERPRKIAQAAKRARDLAAALEHENLAYVFDDLDSLAVLKFLDSKRLAKLKAQVDERTYFDLLRPQIPELLLRLADYVESKSKDPPYPPRPNTSKLAERDFAAQLAFLYAHGKAPITNNVIAACVRILFPRVYPQPDADTIKRW
ncbi:MAG: helix-turn-helix transcriptional regulator [Porticoccaceae bacterium]